MKNLWTFTLLLILTVPVMAQKPTGKDSTNISIGKRDVIIIEDSSGKSIRIEKEEKVTMGDPDAPEDDGEVKKKSYSNVGLFAMELGMTTFMDYNSFTLGSEKKPFELNVSKSIHVGLHFFPTRIALHKEYIALMTAIDLDIHNYRFERNITLLPEMDTVTWYMDSINFEKNKLTTTYLQVPLMLKFQTSPDNKAKNVKFGFGGYVGLRIGTHTKQKSDEYGKVKQYDPFNVSPVKFGVTGRLGYRFLNFYANYDLTPLFEENEGPRLTPVTFGIEIIPFN